MRAYERGAGFKALNGVLKIAVSDGGGTDDERAIGDGLGDRSEFLCVGEDIGCCAHGRASAFKGDVIGIDDTQVKESEIAHGASGRADVQGIARVDQDDAQAIEFRGSSQADLFYGRRGWNAPEVQSPSSFCF